MKITINGKASSVDREPVTVTELLAIGSVESPDMVSVQVNGEILERGAYDTTHIRAGDEIEFLYFMGGGAHA